MQERSADRVVALRVLDADLRVIDGVDGEEWTREDLPFPVVSLELATHRTAAETWVVLAALADTGAEPEPYQHFLRTLRLSRECPALP